MNYLSINRTYSPVMGDIIDEVYDMQLVVEQESRTVETPRNERKLILTNHKSNSLNK